MGDPRQLRSLILSLSSGAATAALAIAFMLIFFATQPAHTQTFKVIHNFTVRDGYIPFAGVTMDKKGNLYGTANLGGGGYGTAYELSHQGSNWIFNLLYSFVDFSVGAYPQARVIFGPNGALYGTTYEGGPGCYPAYPSCGTVFKLRPSPVACKTLPCRWTETVLDDFHGPPDGAFPGYGDLLFDQAGNIYGTTFNGGIHDAGTVYELTPSGSGWTESVLYSFGSGSDGVYPYNGVILDSGGNLYGTTAGGGPSHYGTVFQLVPATGGWRENILYNFQNGSDGDIPRAGLLLDSSGSIYGSTGDGGSGGGGTVFKLTPSGGSWTYSLVYSFTGGPGCGPFSSLVMDGAGNLYGTTVCGGVNAGSVFKLTPSANGWTYTSLHDFNGVDGQYPYGGVVSDAEGNLYGTASQGGQEDGGIVWEITP